MHENYKKYDFRYGNAELKKKSIRRRMLQVLKQRDAEEMAEKIQMARS